MQRLQRPAWSHSSSRRFFVYFKGFIPFHSMEPEKVWVCFRNRKRLPSQCHCNQLALPDIAGIGTPGFADPPLGKFTFSRPTPSYFPRKIAESLDEAKHLVARAGTDLETGNVQEPKYGRFALCQKVKSKRHNAIYSKWSVSYRRKLCYVMLCSVGCR